MRLSDLYNLCHWKNFRDFGLYNNVSSSYKQPRLLQLLKDTFWHELGCLLDLKCLIFLRERKVGVQTSPVLLQSEV